jgi:hypothetical protein
LSITLCAVEDVRGALTVRPSLTIDESYDSNPYFRSENVKSDFVTRITPRIGFQMEKIGFDMSAFYRFDSRFYTRNPELNNTSHRANIGMDMEVSKNLSLGFGDTFTYTQESREAIETGIQTQRTDIMYNNMFINAGYTFTPRSSINARLSDSIIEFESQALIDTRTDSAALTARYKLTPERSLNTTYTYTNFSFDTNADIDTHSLQLELADRISPALSFNISSGVVYTPEIDNRYDWTARAGVVKTFQSSSINLGYTREVTNTSGLADEISINNRAYLGWNFLLGRSFNVTVSGSYYKNRSEPETRVDTSSYNAGINAVWQVYNWMRVGAGYSHFQQLARDSLGEDITRDQVSVNISIAPTEWRF